MRGRCASPTPMIGTDAYRITIELAHDPNPTTRDYRYSDISVLQFDTANMPPLSMEPLRAKLLGQGVIRLFRDFEESDDTEKRPGDETMVSIIALPTYFTATDVLGFIGDHYMEYVTHIRILKTERANRFLVLIKFKDIVKAAEFQYHYDGKPFNSMESETCHVVFVKSVVLDLPAPDIPNKDALIPFLLQDPFTSTTTSPVGSPRSSSVAKLEEGAPIELPTCPVCLERLDYDISGLLTIPCQHTFHCLCLSKWRDDTCPVCRYTNNISNHKIRRSVRRLLQINLRMQQQLQQQLIEEEPLAPESSETCMQCPAADNLWVCLICGNVGCSRYAPEQHSLKHFVETGHCFAMELTTSRVWDYAGDNYVHRLITSEADGKIVEFPEKAAKESESKVELKEHPDSEEYLELLLSQLISQREYYELLLNERNQSGGMRLRRGSSIVEGGIGSKRVAELESKVADLTDKFSKLSQNVVPALKRKIDMKDTSLRVASQELNETNSLNEGLLAKVEYLTQENAKLKAENEDLSDQVKDLMFYLESQEKFKDQPDDVKEGTIVMKEKRKPRKKK